MSRFIFIILVLIVHSGCGTTYNMTSSGPVGLKDSDFHIEAKLQYEGNSDYLPRTVSEAENTEGLPVISYSYTVGYGKTPFLIFYHSSTPYLWWVFQ